MGADREGKAGGDVTGQVAGVDEDGEEEERGEERDGQPGHEEGGVRLPGERPLAGRRRRCPPRCEAVGGVALGQWENEWPSRLKARHESRWNGWTKGEGEVQAQGRMSSDTGYVFRLRRHMPVLAEEGEGRRRRLESVGAEATSSMVSREWRGVECGKEEARRFVVSRSQQGAGWGLMRGAEGASNYRMVTSRRDHDA